MAKSDRLTALQIRQAKPQPGQDRWLTDNDGTRGGGRLVLRVSPKGTKLFYYRYIVDKKRHVIPIGPFTHEPADGRFTLEQARAKAGEYEALHRQPESHHVTLYLRAEEQKGQQAAHAAAEAAREQQEQRERASQCTVRALCDWYVTHLQRAGKTSANDVRTIFTKNVYETEWASVPAANLTSKQAAALLRSVVDRGKGRTAAKLRAYLRAAYALALKADLDASAPAELLKFGVLHNPVAPTGTLSQYNRTLDRVLSDAELGALWRRLNEPSVGSDVALLMVRLNLLLGGQRPTQLLRAQIGDVDTEAGSVVLFDGKGRRTSPRRHLVPVVGVAVDLVRHLVARSGAAGSSYLFASGTGHVVISTVGLALERVAAAMHGDGEATADFKLRDLRRTIETSMARLGVSKDLRAQLQSHGLGGVQQRHYDRHDYMIEKRSALVEWQAHLARIARQQRSGTLEVVQAESAIKAA